MKTQIMKTLIGAFSIFVVVIAVGLSVTAQSVMIVDRGLPTANLNLAAGTNRSNLAYGAVQPYFRADDFTLPPSGRQFWRIDTIRMWHGGGSSDNDIDLLNDFFLGNIPYGNLSLWVGTDAVSRVSVAQFLPGGNATNNPNVVSTRVQYNDVFSLSRDYELPPPYGWATINQLDFNNLNIIYAGGTKVRFGIHTDGNQIVFSHVSNAALSGSRQDQANGLQSIYQFIPASQPKKSPTARFIRTWDISQGGWDKPADINVQVWATLVNKPR